VNCSLCGFLKGDVDISLAGSDVANIRSTAHRDGDHYIVNGAKKWITNGVWADYCTAAVRTGGPGGSGISLLVIPLAVPGVTRRRMHNSGVNASGKYAPPARVLKGYQLTKIQVQPSSSSMKSASLSQISLARRIRDFHSSCQVSFRIVNNIKSSLLTRNQTSTQSALHSPAHP
jgi:hypothetical protein